MWPRTDRSPGVKKLGLTRGQLAPVGRPSPDPSVGLLRPGQGSDPRVGRALGPRCLQLLLGPPHEMVATEAPRDLGGPRGVFSGQDLCVCACVSEYLTWSGACSTSEPGIYTAPRWRLQFILNERIINSVDRMMYLKHLPITAQSPPRC